MQQIKKIRTRTLKAPQIIEELSVMSCEEIMELFETRKKEYLQKYNIDIDQEISRRMRLLEEQSRILRRQTEPTPSQMLVHFDI